MSDQLSQAGLLKRAWSWHAASIANSTLSVQPAVSFVAIS
jgi:hypothetical protein